MDATVALLQLFLTLGLVVIGVWYTIETQRLRVVAQQQMAVANAQGDIMKKSVELTKSSFDANLLPYLITGIAPTSEAVVATVAADSPLGRIHLPGVGKVTKSSAEHRALFFEVRNITEKIASHLFCIFFDRRNNHNYVSSYILDALGPDQRAYIPFLRETFSLDEIKKTVNLFYEKRGEYLVAATGAAPILDQYAASGDSHVLVIFFDLAGKLYAIPRLVVTDASLSFFQFGKSDLIQPDPWWFAPSFGSTDRITAQSTVVPRIA